MYKYKSRSYSYKMTNFNYDLFKVSKMYFLKLWGFSGVNAYV